MHVSLCIELIIGVPVISASPCCLHWSNLENGRLQKPSHAWMHICTKLSRNNILQTWVAKKKQTQHCWHKTTEGATLGAWPL